MPRRLLAIVFALTIPVEVLAQSAPAQPPPQTPAPLIYQEPLSRTAIERVQDQLRDKGNYGGDVSGTWDSDSEAALTQFQQTHGLQPTGQLNQATALLLGLKPEELLDAAAPAPAPASAPAPVAVTTKPPPPPEGAVLSIAAVRNLQSRLRTLGYYSGSVDGQWGPRAQDALRRFQLASGIEVSGRINPQTVTAMGIDPNNLESAARP